MKKLLATLLFLGSLAFAQPSVRQIRYVTTDPTGTACPNTAVALLTTNGNLYTCQSGVFALVPSGTIPATGVTAGTYGDSTHVGRFTVNASGQLTFATSTGISGVGGAGTPPYVSSFTGTTQTITAATHGQGVNPIVTVTDNATPKNQVYPAITIASNGDVVIGPVTSGTYNFWIDGATGGFANPMTTSGDFLYENATPAPARLAGNSTGTLNVLSMTSSVPSWITTTGSGTTAVLATSPTFITSALSPIWSSTASMIIRPGADATTAIQVQNAAGTANILTVNTTSKIVTISGPNNTTLFQITDSSSGAILMDATGNDLNSGSYMRTGVYRAFTGTNYTTEPIRINGPSSRIDMNANTYLAWYSTTGSITGAPDTVLSRDAAGIVDFGTTGQGSKAGSWNATNGTLSNQLALSGNVTLPMLFAKITAAATAPSAGNCTMRWEVGTNAGTGKLVAYCGTSSTGVTIIDNVGAGF